LPGPPFPEKVREMTLHRLKIWITVAECGSITKAAKKLSVKQPTVTQQVRALEKDCRRKLYTIKPGGIEITSAGRLVARYAKRFDRLEKELRKHLKGRRSN